MGGGCRCLAVRRGLDRRPCGAVDLYGPGNVRKEADDESCGSCCGGPGGWRCCSGSGDPAQKQEKGEMPLRL